MTQKDILFLHMGPGYNSFVERRLLGPHLATVEFWDQPYQQKPHQAFSRLVEATLEKVMDMYKAKGSSPIAIVTHSFGAHIATEIIRKHPELVNRINLISPNYDLRKSFVNLARNVLTASDIIPEPVAEGLKLKLKLKLKSLASPISKDDFWEIINVLLKYPNYFKLYWASEEAMNQFLLIAKEAPEIHLESFINVSNDFLDRYQDRELVPVAWNGHVSVFFGQQDPMINMEAEKAIWRSIYPQAQIEVIENISHNLHFEIEQKSKLFGL